MTKTQKRVKQIKEPVEKKKTDPIDLPSYDSKFDDIREHSQMINPLAEWQFIKKWLNEEPDSISELRTQIKKHADVTERSRRLAAAAERELRLFELKCKDRKQIWRLSAINYWEKQKENKEITKQITEKMIEDWIIEQHSDLFIELEKRLIELDEVYKQLKSLPTQVSNKGHNLRKLLDSEIKRPAGSPNWIDNDK